MTTYDTGKDARVTLGDGVVVVHRRGVSEASVANVLSAEHDAASGVERIYVDRLLHRPRESVLGEWDVSGAVSSILTRPLAGHS